jgi:ubiquinone/menaquinone biosynthesis C-methylase UbiE
MKNCFDQYTKEYDNWYETNKDIYNLELEAITKIMPAKTNSLEIGVGTGRFASRLEIGYGIEPSFEMGLIAKSRDVNVIQAKGENLPFRDKEFDLILLVTVICFVKDIPGFLLELKRVLKENGDIILAFIDKNTPLGKKYEEKKANHIFYKYATFYNTREILNFLDSAGFKAVDFAQTIFENQEKNVKDGYGEGAFVVVKAQKIK